MQEIEKVEIAIQSPRGILRQAINVRFLSEDEGNECMKMVELRNKTSHIYHEEMAEEIAQKIPIYYKLIKKIVGRLEKID